MVARSAQKQPNKSFYKVAVTTLIVVFLAVCMARVVLANILATSGERLAAANQKIKTLEEENQKLGNQVSALGSLARIEESAQRTGLVRAENVEVLVPSLPIASR